MSTDMFPGIANPTRTDRVGAEIADEQLKLILGLRQIRVERDLSITEVAHAMGVDVAQVSRFESGATNPTMSTIRRYAKAVDAVFRVRVKTWEQDHTDRVLGRAMAIWENVDNVDPEDADDFEVAMWIPQRLELSLRDG